MRVLILAATTTLATLAGPAAAPALANSPAGARAWEGVNHPLDGWTPIDASQGVLLLVKPSAASPLGPSFRRIWVRWEWTSPQAADHQRYLSSAAFYDLDCANTKLRLISVIDYQNRDLGGDVVRENSAGGASWDFGPPGTINDTLIKFACDKARN